MILDLTEHARREAGVGDRVLVLLAGVHGRTWVPGEVIQEIGPGFEIDVEGCSPTWREQRHINQTWRFES